MAKQMSEGTIAIILAVIDALVALFPIWNNRRKQKADTSDVLGDMALSLIIPFRERVDELVSERDDLRTAWQDLDRQLDELQADFRQLKREYDELLIGAKRLAAQVESMGGTPVCDPEDMT